MRASTQAVTITQSDDPTPGSISTTSGFTGSVFNAAADGCSFRRAVLEAAARPPTDRPITVAFNLAANDPNKDLNAANHQIISNTIGLRANGTMPVVPAALCCLKSLDFDPSNWYGGWGISIAGAGHTMRGNAIAGLHRPMTANETAAVAIDILGLNHTVNGNTIGLDRTGAEVGTCSTGIKVAGNNTAITQNTLAGVITGFEAAGSETLDYAIMAND